MINYIQLGNTKCIRELIAAGAKVGLKNDEEKTPMHVAAEKGKSNVIRLLANHDKNLIFDEDEDSNQALHLAAFSGFVRCVKVLIQNSAPIVSRNSKGWTPLDCAANEGSVEICTELLDNDYG